MKKSIAILAAVGMASTVSAQAAWDVEFSEPILSPGTDTTRVTLSFEPEAPDYALGGLGWSVHADESGWSDLRSEISHPGQGAGTIDGASVRGASGGYLFAFGFEPTPGRVAVWSADYTVTDFTARDINVSTETTRYEAYPEGSGPGSSAEPRDLPREARGSIQVVPAPASLALLGLGGLAAARRRR